MNESTFCHELIKLLYNFTVKLIQMLHKLYIYFGIKLSIFCCKKCFVFEMVRTPLESLLKAIFSSSLLLVPVHISKLFIADFVEDKHETMN